MVHHGPARGCQRCKDRHCGLERPACRQCVKLKFRCPGYHHELDVVLRNQTTSVVRRHGGHRNGRKSAQAVGTNRLNKPSLPRQIVSGVDTFALPFLVFGSGLMEDGRTSHGHLDSLQSLYRESAPMPLFTLTTTWMATLVMSMICSTGKQQCLDEEGRLMAKVIQSIRKAVSDPVSSVSVETLAAVVILGHGEFLRSKLHRSPTSENPPRFIVHQAGAEALIRRRGLLNFQDSSSVALFAAVRHNAVNIASLAPQRSETLNWDLWNIVDDRFRELCDSYTPATELDACGARMVCLKRRLQDTSEHDESAYLLQDELLALFQRIQSWQWHIPTDWRSNEAATELSHQAPSVQYLFNEWYLLQIEASHLIKQFNVKSNDQIPCETQYTCEMEWIDSVLASAYPLLGHVPAPHLKISRKGTPIARKNCDALRGPRLFGQSIEKLEVILLNALKSLNLPEMVESRYIEILDWVRVERNI
ncbi:C6 finger domain protein, putative [Talaromyces islandicus]|uniref:C6 finger domain protein, putative n=1 Tax=Talaromyces islandicus TaxID=28573 RepID=A0A0U1M1W8_TALIS|nr:C6 finger domain protein, putative [Talaromyces islandicus]